MPSSLELTPQLEAIFTKMGLGAGTFLAHVPGKSTRGVEVSWLTRDRAQFRVCALATGDDYALAAKLAASLAQLVGAKVEAEHGVDGGAIDGLSPSALLSTFDTAFFEKNARDMGNGLLSQVVGGASYFFFTPAGWVALRPEHFVGVDVAERITRARKVLLDAQSATSASLTQTLPSHGAAIDGKRIAVLLARGMVFAAAADGKLDPAEARVLERHFLTVNALRGYDPQEILQQAQAQAQTHAAASSHVREIVELPTLYRHTAFVLAAEILACTRGGMIAGDLNDPNVKAAMTLASVLGLTADENFLVRTSATIAAKYVDAGTAVTDEMARTMTLAMLLAAAADGRVTDHETAVMAALAQTVPELRARDFAPLVEQAKGRVAQAAGDFAAMPKFKNKTFGLACEIALCSRSADAGGSRVSVPPVLDQLQTWLGIPKEFADGAIRIYAAKYAVTT